MIDSIVAIGPLVFDSVFLKEWQVLVVNRAASGSSSSEEDPEDKEDPDWSREMEDDDPEWKDGSGAAGSSSGSKKGNKKGLSLKIPKHN